MRAISLFSGAGGFDVGFADAGVDIAAASEMDSDAGDTYKANHPQTVLVQGDIRATKNRIAELADGIDIVFGGPPCQGFSVIGKKDPDDLRSQLIWEFADVVELVRPKAFVMENVKALAEMAVWEPVRERYLERMDGLGYDVRPFLLNAKDFGVPQKRERVFFVGFRKDLGCDLGKLEGILESEKSVPPTVREVLLGLPEIGTEGNPRTCVARVTLLKKPVLRRSPYAGLLFNGKGRPIDLDGCSNTLLAAMGGGNTPIIDEACLRDPSAESWVEMYHRGLADGSIAPASIPVPENVRRLTIREAAAIQTFPCDYVFKGAKSNVYRQIGNAVPCKLAKAVAEAVVKTIREATAHDPLPEGDALDGALREARPDGVGRSSH